MENVVDTALISAHPETKHGKVVQVMDKIIEAGIKNVVVSVTKPG